MKKKKTETRYITVTMNKSSIINTNPLSWLPPILDKIRATMEAKNHDYAGGLDWKDNFIDYGLFGMMARLNDKVKRAENLICGSKNPAVVEGVEDTLEDLAAYALLISQAIKEDLPLFGKFEVELKRKVGRTKI